MEIEIRKGEGKRNETLVQGPGMTYIAEFRRGLESFNRSRARLALGSRTVTRLAALGGRARMGAMTPEQRSEMGRRGYMAGLGRVSEERRREISRLGAKARNGK